MQDENGRIIYSDQFHPDAEIVKVTKSTNYKPPVINNQPGETVKEANQGRAISISSPQEGEAIWANDGELSVSVNLQPGLNIEKGEKVLVMLDGAAMDPESSTEFMLPITERGAHTVSASLINASGDALATSAPVSFQLHRASVGNN